MNNPITLDDYYRYWDEFYKAWCHHNKTEIKNLGWDIPNFSGGSENMKNVLKKYKTIDLLPEPWWGNSGYINKPLESVVINFNPGNGGNVQLRQNFSCTYKYSRYVTDQIDKYINAGNNKSICATSNWHYTNRAIKIYETLKSHKYNHYDLTNHLSIELVPWHSISSNDIIGYCAKNRYAIFDYCIKFAAEASKFIKNPQLHNIVILRMSSNFFKQIMGGIGGLNYVVQEKEINGTPSPSYYCIFEFLSIPEIWFVCIWGRYTRNSFPIKCDLETILEEVQQYKKDKNLITNKIRNM